MVVLPSMSHLSSVYSPPQGTQKRPLFPPRDFSPSATMLFCLIIYVENIENLTYIPSTKKPGIPTLFRKKKQQQHQLTRDIVSRKALDFSRRLPRGRWQQIKKNKVFRVLVIWVNHLIANCVCVCVCVCVGGDNYFVASTAQRAKYSIRYRLIEGQKKTIKGLMPEGTNSRCPLKVSKLAG